MSTPRVGRVGVVAVALAIVAGILALVNEVIRYRRSGAVDWGHVALAIGVPALMYGIVRGVKPRR
jgi:hypothetical protein